MRNSGGTGSWGELGRGRRGSIAIWIAVMAPGLLMATAFGIEVGGWAAAQVSLQRSADVAATAGAIFYLGNNSGQKASTFAARIAQLNGGGGTTSPTWNAQTNTLSDNQITAQVINGRYSVNDMALQVTIQKTIPAGISSVFNSRSSYTVTGTSIAELVQQVGPALSGPAAGQPCLVALSTSGTISGTGSTYWTMPNCTVVSNGTISVTGGGGPLNTAGFFAGGSINIQTWISSTGGQYPNNGTIPDPYANNTTLQTALTTAAGLTGVSGISCGTTGGVIGTAGQYTGDNNCNGTNTLPNGGTCVTGSGVTCTMYPGNYSTWNVPQGGPYTFNLQPGLYLFNGAINLTNQTTTNGSGVTIITAGSFTGSNSFNFNVSAPTPAQVSSTGGVAAIALASSSSTTATISGNAAFNISGVAYFPNAQFNAIGASCNSSAPCFGTGSTACLEIIATSILTTGNSNFNSNCNSLGATTFASAPNQSVTTAQVVH
jgi:Flp pilus assembly protein TadG